MMPKKSTIPKKSTLPKNLRLNKMNKFDFKLWEKLGCLLPTLPPSERKEMTCKLWDSLRSENAKKLDLVLDYAYKNDLLTKCEFNSRLKGRFTCPRTGMDSLSDLLISYVNARQGKVQPIFVTTNEKVLKEREFIKKRFNLRVVDPAEAVKMLGGLDATQQDKHAELDKLMDDNYGMDKGYGA